MTIMKNSIEKWANLMKFFLILGQYGVRTQLNEKWVSIIFSVKSIKKLGKNNEIIGK